MRKNSGFSYDAGSRVRRAWGRWCSSAGKLALAKPPWSRCCARTWHGKATPASGSADRRITHSALYPVIEHVKRVLRLDHHDSPETTLDKLERALQRFASPGRSHPTAGSPALSAAARGPLSGPDPDAPAAAAADAGRLVAWLVEEAERRPVLAVYEDMHWADPSTLELLGMLVEQAPTVPMLHVLAFRPDFVPPWSPRAHLTPLTLNRLDRPQVEALIRHLAGGKALPVEVVQHIVTRTDGVPLFVEELTRMVLESGRLREDGDHYVLTGPRRASRFPPRCTMP